MVIISINMGKTKGESCHSTAATSRRAEGSGRQATLKSIRKMVVLAAGEQYAETLIDSFEQQGYININQLQEAVARLDRSISTGQAEKIVEMAAIFSPALDDKKFIAAMERAEKDFPTNDDFEQYFIKEIKSSDSFAPHLQQVRQEMLADNPQVGAQEVEEQALRRARGLVYHGNWKYNTDQPGIPPPEIWISEQIRAKTADIFEQCGGDRQLINSSFQQNPLILAKADNPQLFAPAPDGASGLSLRRSSYFFIEPNGQLTGDDRQYQAKLDGRPDAVRVIEKRTSDGRGLQVQNQYSEPQAQVQITQSAADGSIKYQVQIGENDSQARTVSSNEVDRLGGLELWALSTLDKIVTENRRSERAEQERLARDPEKQHERLMNF